MMHKANRYFLIVFLFACSVAANAQSKPTFIVQGDAVKKEIVEHTGYLENSKITVVNTSDEPIYLEWETVSNTFPKSWDCSMCQHGKCQIGIPKGSIFKKLDSQQEGFIAIHVLPDKYSGSGTVKFKIYDKEHPEYYKILTFSVKVL